MNARASVASLILRVIASLSGGAALSQEQIEALLETPKDSSHGDLAFPCFQLAKALRKGPPMIAQDLASKLVEALSTEPAVARVVAKGPYVNFFLNKGALAATLVPAILNGSYLARRATVAGRIMVEYSQPNTHKAFHVGHIRCAALGDALIRVLAWLGHDVVASNYLGDEGTHVAKCLWYYTQVYKGDVPATNRGEFLGKLYTAATDQLDLGLLTRAPYRGVRAARVLTIAQHPRKPEWMVVELETIDGPQTVVTGVGGFAVGDVVPHARPGVKVADKAVGLLDKLGIQSHGMLCSEFEIGLSEVRDRVLVLPAATAIGTEVAELYRIAGALPETASVLEEFAARERAVSQVLQRLEANEPEMKAIWQETKDWSMQELYEIYRWLDCRFDHYFFESQFGERGKALVQEHLKRGVFVASDGAIGADLSAFGLGFCLLLKRDGTATYATRDLALAERKFAEFGITRSFNVVDSAQTLHFQQVYKCLELMGFPQAKQSYHLSYAQVVRPDGKMSSRKGNVILFSELKSRLLGRINTEFLHKYEAEWPAQEIATAAHHIALATMRYGMLLPENNSQVVFDLDEWTARSGNTGPYMLYAAARIYSILRDAGAIDHTTTDWSLLGHELEGALMMQLSRYHKVVALVGQEYSMHSLCHYLFELSKSFSSFYAECSVLNADTAALRQARLGLSQAVVLVLEHGLGLLGIPTVQRM